MNLLKITLLFIFLGVQFVLAQQDVNVTTKETKRGTIFRVENNTDSDKTIKLIIKSPFFKRGNAIVEKKVKANRTKKFYKLKHKESINFETEIVIKGEENNTIKNTKEPVIVEEEVVEEPIIIEEVDTATFDFTTDNVKKGIVIFTKNTCARCRFAEKYFEDNEIVYKNISTTDTSNGKSVMWELLSEESEEIQHVTMPVILIDGKITYSHSNLAQFLKEIKI